MSIPVIVVTGFLGCGKTSFLRNLLPLCGEADLRPALIINEVGDIDVDGELLADLHAEQVRLVGGCICCTLQSRLTETIYNVLENKSSDVIIIECSGLSNPLDVVSALSTPALVREIAVSHIVCLLDSRRAERILGAIELAKSQVASSDIIILNKSDLANESLRAQAESLARELSPQGVIRHASYGDISRDSLIRLLTDSAQSLCQHGCNCNEPDHHHGHSHTLPASFCTTALELPPSAEMGAMQAFLESLPDSVIRAKGFADLAGTGWHILQKVYESVSITPLSGPAPKSGAILICIGQRLFPDKLRDLCGNAFAEKAQA